MWWSRLEASEARSARVPGADTSHTLEGLACGAQYRVTLRAHNAVGASPHSRPLVARTRGDSLYFIIIIFLISYFIFIEQCKREYIIYVEAKAALGKEFIWANSTHFRFNLLAWGGRCPIASWALAIRVANGGTWRNIIATGEAAEVRRIIHK